MSSAPSVNELLTGYLAGQIPAERVVPVVAAAYWEQGARSREQLKELMDIIERAHPGVVMLAATSDQPGFTVQLSERPFPKQYEGELRQAAQMAIDRDAGGSSAPRSLLSAPSLFTRIVAAIRRVFSA